MSARDQPAAHRNQGLDGLRALAALSVLVFHVWLYRTNRPTGPRPELLDKVMFELNTGLICFFVLSGYLLYTAFVRSALTGGPRVDLGTYGVRRVARIVPAYYVCIAVSLVLFAIVGFSALTPDLRLLPVYLLFGQNYSMATIGKVNPVAWTLAVEVAFYVVLPLIGLVASALGRRVWAQVVFLLVIVAGSVTWNIVIWKQGSPDLWRQGLPAYLGIFAVGMLVAVWVEWRRARSAPVVGPVWTAMLVLAGLALVFANGYWHETAPAPTELRIGFGLLTCGAGFALVVAAVAGGTHGTWSVRWLAWRPLVAVGIVSYGLYLWHLPVLVVVRALDLLPYAFVPRLLVVLVLSLAVAAVSWHWVEKPCLAWAHRRRPGRRVPDPVPEPA